MNDKDRDKWIKHLNKNQAILIKNNDYFIEKNKNYWAWIQHLQKRIQALEAADKQFKQADMEFDKRLEDVGASLYSAAKAKSETVEAEGEAQQ